MIVVVLGTGAFHKHSDIHKVSFTWHSSVCGQANVFFVSSLDPACHSTGTEMGSSVKNMTNLPATADGDCRSRPMLFTYSLGGVTNAYIYDDKPTSHIRRKNKPRCCVKWWPLTFLFTLYYCQIPSGYRANEDRCSMSRAHG